MYCGFSFRFDEIFKTQVESRTNDLEEANTKLNIEIVERKQAEEKLRTQLKEAGMTPVANDPLKEVGKDYT